MSRVEQINDQLHQTLAEILSTAIELPLDFLVSVTKFECEPNLQTAKVSLSILPFNKAQDGMNWVIAHRKEIQYQLGLRMKRLHHTPVMRFYMDDTEEKVSEIYSLIDNA
jgi:ribosome-binding factor A